MSKPKNRLIHGWGINDVDYAVTRYEKINNKSRQVWTCPYYTDWRSIIQRCFDPKEHQLHPTYSDCTIADGWKYLSNYIRWVDEQPNRDWENCSPDKDFLIVGNKHYSPDTVVYIPKKLNNFITDSGAIRGKFMIGVSLSDSKKNPYVANCRNPFNNKGEYLGLFPTELSAHLAWKAKKHEHACKWASLQQDNRVAEALRSKFL